MYQIVHTVIELMFRPLAVLCSKLLYFRRRFGPTILAGPPSFRHMLELKIRSLTCIFYITQFQLSSDSRETFVKVAIFMKQKMVLFTKVVPTFELS